MKITKSQLKQIIQEELASVLNEQVPDVFQKYGVMFPRRIIRDFQDFYDYYTYVDPLPGSRRRTPLGPSVESLWADIPNEVKEKFMAREGDVGLASGGVK